MENWKEIKGWEGYYEVSDYGRIKSVDRIIDDIKKGRTVKIRGRILKQAIIPAGYCQVVFSRRGIHFNIPVHRTVLEAFVGPCPANMVACHNDGDKLNNKLSNLRWDTQGNNLLDKLKHGTDQFGEKNAMAILTESQVDEIRARLNTTKVRGIGRQLAREYGVSPSTISAINVGKRWVDPPIIT